MRDPVVEVRSILAELEGDRTHAELFRRLVEEHPDKLTKEVLTAALRRGLISAPEAIRMARQRERNFGVTLALLSSLCLRVGLRPADLVLEVLEGQPH